MSRRPRLLPPNRADYTFANLLEFHLFVFGTRPEIDPDAPSGSTWGVKEAWSGAGVTERTLNNWLAGRSLPSRVPPKLNEMLFGSEPRWQPARAELTRKLREEQSSRPEQVGSEQGLQTGETDETASNGDEIREISGMEAQTSPQVPSGVSEDSRKEGAAAPDVPVTASQAGGPPRRRSAFLALALLLLLVAVGIAAWQVWPVAPVVTEAPSKPVIVAKDVAPGPVQPDPPAPAPVVEPTPPPAFQTAKTGLALLEGKWRLKTIPDNTDEDCDNPGRDMDIKIDAKGTVTDMCAYLKRVPGCTPFSQNIRRRTVSEKGAFDFSYVVDPKGNGNFHENILRGTITGDSGGGTFTSWRRGARTSCPEGEFTLKRID